MPINSLSVFYTVPDRWELYPSGFVQMSWKCDPNAILEIGKAGDFDISGGSLTDLQAVNTYFDRRLIVDRDLTMIVVDRLYQMTLAPRSPIRSNCWFNFISVMTVKAARHAWQRIPQSQQSEELFEQLIEPRLRIEDLLTGFDPAYHPNLLVGLQAWTYKVVKYKFFDYLRTNGHPCFGLTNFGIVARSSYKLMRTAAIGNITLTQVELFISTCKIFKIYLERSKVGTNNLQLDDWHQILAEVRSFDLDLTIEELRDRVDRIGGFIRGYRSLKIERYDDPDRSSSSIDLSALKEDRYPSASELDIESSELMLGQIFTIIDRFMSSLDPEPAETIVLRHQQKLTQADIAKLIDRDQSKISRQLGRIYLELIDLIHLHVTHPDDGDAKKNSHSIVAVRQLLDRYFQRS